jgi:nucleotidyltransferase substrate binding protein (TIGR01987 family)
MRLDLSSLVRALASLDKAIVRSQGAPDDAELRDAVIQRFEYTYELCWKLLRRRLEEDAADRDSVAQLSFRELIRAGAEHGFVDDVETWLVYREHRNLSSHIYDERKAERVHRTAVAFAPAARALLMHLEAANDA